MRSIRLKLNNQSENVTSKKKMHHFYKYIFTSSCKKPQKVKSQSQNLTIRALTIRMARMGNGVSGR